MVDRSQEIRRVLVTGINGAAGRLFIDYMSEQHPTVQVHGTVRRKHARTASQGVTLHEADLLDSGSLHNAIRASQPDCIFHMAASSDKGFEVPAATLMNNAVGTANLLEVARQHKAKDPVPYSIAAEFGPVFVMVSTSEVYGAVQPEDVPIKETCPLRPVSPYGISKLAADHLARLYHAAYGLRVVVTRAFSYINVYHPVIFTTAFARQIAEIEAGQRNVLKVGNLDSVRTFVGAEAYMHAYWLAATRCRFGEAYNIGGNCVLSVREVLQRMIGLAARGGKFVSVPIEEDPALLRPVDVTQQIPDCSKFINETGWTRSFDLDAELTKLLDYWRRKVCC